MKKHLLATIIGSSLLLSLSANAADYVIDTQGAHASIQFSVSHLGYSFVVGRFNEFSGNFSFDQAKIADAKVNVKINTTSVDSNHAERDKHLRGADFLNSDKFPEASFVSTSIVDNGNNQFVINGDFTFNGVTKPLSIDAKAIGEGKDPWGGYRAGFTGKTTFAMKDYGVKMDLGPASANVVLDLVVEGIKQ
ncbi:MULTISPECIES: YceI family protein [Shewanella]|jgi:polyisoprenoid-binding protein YceI|uniref:YceI family protein n=1 Tax=Shewanella TaxID=22 RepID=UPI00200CA447|nr:YceI family protein [Shewanella basaltis]MCL1113199.1 YceI family protein [Shewanella basaltis]